MTAPTCRCGRAMRPEASFRLEHEDDDHPGTTMQLVATRAELEAVGAWGTEVTLYYCEPCDIAEAHFAYPEGEGA
jgi:hypothetical protein